METMEDGNAMQGLGKRRMKWTAELHRCFEQAVNQLGGPDRATPKGIFRVMSMPGLTITHVKSHLQKYRMSNFVLESSDRDKLGSKPASEILPNFCAASQFQIIEALKMHMEIRRKSQDQLELQAWRLQKEILYFLNISLSRVNPKSGAPPLSCSGALVIQLELHLNRNSS